jgi:hypothetical protein
MKSIIIATDDRVLYKTTDVSFAKSVISSCVGIKSTQVTPSYIVVKVLLRH